jgi:sigma-B regulation protein RsbU (phosphoserine phosphatase)
METGDILLLYTDGLIEAMNRKGEEFGSERFQKCFREASATSADDVLDSIMGELEAFSSGTSATDDITLIAVEKR